MGCRVAKCILNRVKNSKVVAYVEDKETSCYCYVFPIVLVALARVDKVSNTRIEHERINERKHVLEVTVCGHQTFRGRRP